MTIRPTVLRILSLGIALAVAGCGSSTLTAPPDQTAGTSTAATSTPGVTTAPPPPPSPADTGTIHLIKHVIVIMQENRSFDSYFGTYPGADGIPMSGGKPSV